jgi:branched-chain amino acid transport system ATP-binding protein
MEKQATLTMKGVSKRFGDFKAVDKINLEVLHKETLGIIGPNGAGKTTLVNLITGYHLPDEGLILFEGENITNRSPAKRVSLGIVRTFQLAHVFDNLTVFENLGLSFFRKRENKRFSPRICYTSFREPTMATKIKEALEMLELDRQDDEIVGNLPLGSKKRLELAMAFVSDPRVVIFDEPFAGLGDQEIDEVISIMKKHRHNRTILVIEHKVSKLTEFADRLAVMYEGRVICCGDCEETLRDPEVRRSYWKISG